MTGEHNTNEDDGDARHNVIRIIDHENFDADTIDFDYSILEIDCQDKIDLTDKARAACLPEPGMIQL